MNLFSSLDRFPCQKLFHRDILDGAATVLRVSDYLFLERFRSEISPENKALLISVPNKNTVSGQEFNEIEIVRKAELLDHGAVGILPRPRNALGILRIGIKITFTKAARNGLSAASRTLLSIAPHLVQLSNLNGAVMAFHGRIKAAGEAFCKAVLLINGKEIYS